MRAIAASVVLLVLGGLHLARAQPDPSAAHPAADNLSIRWGVETNLVNEGSRFRSSLTLENRGEVPLKSEGWTLYFNFLREIDPESVTAPVRLTRINGDFYRLEPTDDFAPLPPCGQFQFTFEAPGSAIKHIDAPAGFYVVFTDAQGEPKPPAPVSDVTIEPFTRPEQTKRGPDDVWPVALV